MRFDDDELKNLTFFLSIYLGLGLRDVGFRAGNIVRACL